MLTDNQGIELARGQEVAYNLSGQVARGIIEHVAQSSSLYRRANIKIRLLHAAAGHQPNRISTVGDSKSVLVLHG